MDTVCAGGHDWEWEWSRLVSMKPIGAGRNGGGRGDSLEFSLWVTVSVPVYMSVFKITVRVANLTFDFEVKHYHLYYSVYISVVCEPSLIWVTLGRRLCH